MRIRSTIVAVLGLAALLAGAALQAQDGKLTAQDFSKVARSHSTAEEHQRLAAHYNSPTGRGAPPAESQRVGLAA